MSLLPINVANYNGKIGALTVNNAIVTPYVLGTSILKGTVECYGDSITIGVDLSSPTTQRYTALLAAQYGFTELNTAVAGDGTQDMLTKVYNNHIPGRTCIVKIGYNDVSFNINTDANMYMVLDDFMAQMLYLCLSSTQLVSNRAPNVTLTGTWANTGFTYGGSYTNTTGSTTQASVTGRYVGFFITVNPSNATPISIVVDGAAALTIVTYYPPVGGTPNGTTWGSLCWFFDTGVTTPGTTHSIAVISTSTITCDIEFFFGFDNLSGATNSPVVVLGLETNSFQQTTANYSAGNLVRQYLVNSFQQQTVTNLRQKYGAKITFCADIPDFSWGNKFSDLIHPDKHGHVRLQQLVTKVLTTGEVLNYV